MPFDLPVGHKFSCLSLEGVSFDTSELRGHPIDLGDGLWIVFGPPFELSKSWRDWLGSLEVDRLQHCSLSLLAIAPSHSPGVLDTENQKLTERAFSLFYALFMVEVFAYRGGIGLSGANVEGHVEVRQTTRLVDQPALGFFRFVDLRLVHFRRASHIAAGIRAMHSPGVETTRLQRGFHAWMRAIRELYADERLHQFVRAIEAVVKPSEGKGRKHFASRGQLFVGESAQNETMLTEIFNMRGAAEHLNSVVDALETYPPKNRPVIRKQRLCQAQLLASFVYERILGDPALRATFTLDDKIAAFWGLRRPDQRSVWGAPFDWVAWDCCSIYRLGRLSRLINRRSASQAYALRLGSG